MCSTDYCNKPIHCTIEYSRDKVTVLHLYLFLYLPRDCPPLTFIILVNRSSTPGVGFH